MQIGALGLVEVLGSANAVRVVDQMAKAAEVEYESWNTRCGGHVTVFMSGSVSAITAAVESIRENPPCEVVSCAVISRPAEDTVHMARGEIS